MIPIYFLIHVSHLLSVLYTLSNLTTTAVTQLAGQRVGKAEECHG